ncbi:MAG: twin-arginine translocation pathway signal protein [Alphaproteobacteria bacterium]|nr:twin-arginine translocation pathway signal protein [Alphaproteobacteria bacterium]
MSLSRRSVLSVIGGGVIVAAGSIGTFLATRTPTTALEPWAQAGVGYADPRLEALSWAILAPNPHNRQPWLIRLDSKTTVTLFADSNRKLPATDPYDRQITIGLGCFLEIARMAAAVAGYHLEIKAFPEGEDTNRLTERPVARLEFIETAKLVDPLFAQVLSRRSCKEPFDMTRPPTPAAVEALFSILPDGVRGAGTTESATVARIADLAWKGLQVETNTDRTYRESVDLIRIGRREIEANPDGIDLGGPFLESLSLIGMLDREQLADPASTAFAQGLEMYRALFEATPAFVWLATDGNSRRAQLRAGAAWVRLNLATTAAGLALHPVSQTLQEYPEMTTLNRQIHQELAEPGETVQMLGRLGHGPETAPSPRWPLDSRVVQA